MSKTFNVAVVIGRMQPLHNGHMLLLRKAEELADRVVVLLGSANASESIKNPFCYSERRQMVWDAIDPNSSTFSIKPLNDYTYNDQRWIAEVQRSIVGGWTDYPEKVVLVGHTKDESSYYLKNFPAWDYFEVEKEYDLNATDIREMLFEKPIQYLQGVVPKSVFTWLENWTLSESYKTLMAEYRFIQAYKESWKSAPYAPTFLTVDAVVVQQGHVLMIRRGAAPGKGLRALPGGFLDQNETLIDGMIRELREETGLKIPEKVLKGSIVDQKVFDAPNRSARGRTVTFAFYIELDVPSDSKLPRVKGGDDAAKAEWISLSKVRGEECFEDHAQIIEYFTGA